jgi:hypothetical protein
MQLTAEMMMTAAIAAVREQVVAKGADMQAVTEQKKAGSRIAAMDRPMPIEQHFDFEKPMRFTPVGPMGQHPPEVSRAIHEECLEDQNYARNTGNDDDRRH